MQFSDKFKIVKKKLAIFFLFLLKLIFKRLFIAIFTGGYK